MTKMEPVKKMLRDGLTARRATAIGRKGATRWEIWNGAPDEEALENYLGDLVRWRPEGIWEFQPFETGVPNTSGRDPYAVARAAGIAS